MNDGCPACDWDGEIAHTHDYDHNYYTHVIVKDGELFRGKTCSERTKPRKPPLWKRLLGLTPKSRVAETPDEDPRPTAEGESIPRSVKNGYDAPPTRNNPNR